MYGYIYYRVGRNRAAADDLTHDVFAVALKKFADFDWAEPMDLLCKLARDEIASHYRDTQRRHNHEAARAAMAGLEHRELAVAAIESREAGDLLNSAMATLPEDYRAVLLAKYVDAHTVEQIAAQLGKSPKAVEALLFKARKKLQALLLED